MNMCISDYINNVRINHASKLLLTTNSSIEEIAEKVGYNSSCYFYRTFKKYKNISPAKYKKQFS
ncbi:Melibiose operon regulatory protein [bioreactor metagenome]|uniref:Melibiose operon regulatory protein n=1 Tax=bioreactor metagenome TaxID=1076179 RepID=A0A645IN06_9ZZZZ